MGVNLTSSGGFSFDPAKMAVGTWTDTHPILATLLDAFESILSYLNQTGVIYIWVYGLEDFAR